MEGESDRDTTNNNLIAIAFYSSSRVTSSRRSSAPSHQKIRTRLPILTRNDNPSPLLLLLLLWLIWIFFKYIYIFSIFWFWLASQMSLPVTTDRSARGTKPQKFLSLSNGYPPHDTVNVNQELCVNSKKRKSQEKIVCLTFCLWCNAIFVTRLITDDGDAISG